jgi:hypothetical protein
MKMKFLALTLSAVMVANPLAVFAQATGPQLVDLSKLDMSKLPEAVRIALGANAKQTMADMQNHTTEDLRGTLAIVDAMMAQLDSLQNKAGDDKTMTIIKIAQGAFLFLNTYAVKLHVKDNVAADLVAYLTVGSTILNTAARHYNPTTHTFDFLNNQGRIEPKTVVSVIDESAKEIASRPNLPPDVTEALQTLNQIKGNVELQRSQLNELVENQGGFVQDGLTAINVASILMHLVSPKLAKYADKLLEVAQPAIQAAKQDGSFAAIAANSSKIAKVGAQAMLGTTNVTTRYAKKTGSSSALLSDLPDLYTLAFGYSGTGSQNVILKTMMDLNKTKFNLESTIRCRTTKVEHGQDATECSKG